MVLKLSEDANNFTVTTCGLSVAYDTCPAPNQNNKLVNIIVYLASKEPDIFLRHWLRPNRAKRMETIGLRSGGHKDNSK